MDLVLKSNVFGREDGLDWGVGGLVFGRHVSLSAAGVCVGPFLDRSYVLFLSARSQHESHLTAWSDCVNSGKNGYTSGGIFAIV